MRNHDFSLGRRRLSSAIGIALLPIATTVARAQAPYPSKPMRVIVPFAAGGGGDTLARLMLTPVGAELGQPLVFDNQAGAGGNIGSAAAARAESDGHVLLYGTNGTLAINRTLYKNPGFDPLKELLPVSRLSQLGLIVVVRPGFPATTMPELLKLLKSSPGKYTFGSAGNGTTSHLAGEILKVQAGIAMVHIPYRGGAGAITDLIGGQIDMMIEVMPNAVPHVKSGRLKALAVSTAKRTPGLPDLPTIAESGVPGFEVTAWDALMVPAGTPAPVVARLNSAVHKALAAPELVAQLAARGADAAPTTPEELGRFVRSEIERWGNAVKRSGASVD
jgi:tripartite-type tricarboxylate transporter receptor subunit TctC